MNEKKDYLEEMIRRELHDEADAIEEEVDFSDASEGMPEEVKERIRANLKSQIAEYDREREKEETYSNLSEEDKEALRLGREELRRRAEAGKKKTVVRKKRRVKWFVVLAAALVLTLGLGMNAFGSRERVVSFVKSVVGEREVTKVNSSDENKMIEEEDEEEAYELIAKEFGVEPVKIIWRPQEMKFQNMEYDTALLIAELTYSYNDEKIVYVISASYGDTSWSFEAEDRVTDEYTKDREKCIINVTERETPHTKIKRYSAKFKYQGIEYYMAGTMERAEFDKILEYLHFVS